LPCSFWCTFCFAVVAGFVIINTYTACLPSSPLLTWGALYAFGTPWHCSKPPSHCTSSHTCFHLRTNTLLSVQEYDEAPLSWWLAALECILSAGMTFVLLGLPLWHTAFHPCQQGLATLWGLLCFWVVWFKGCTSVAAYALGPIYATQGPYSMQPGSLRLVLAASVEAALAVVAPVFPLGVLASLACRLLTQQRQSCGERLLRLQPMREVVRPMHFSPYTRGAAGSARSSVSDADE
jgi:hypothetical protein